MNGTARELISVLIPVRNEEKTIRILLHDLMSQTCENIEILLFDDESDDGTAAIVQECMKQDPRIRLYSSSGLPEGWLGKSHACHQLAKHASGKYFLFLDADVRLGKDALLKSVSYMDHYSLGLLSVFPRQIMNTVGEMLSVPVMNYILLSLLPLVLVRTSGYSSLSAANGQFMFFNAALYRQWLPHEKMKMNPVEDIAIARLYKDNRIAVACLTGDDSVRCRMYTRFNDAVEGFSRNITAYFGHSFLLAFLFWLTTTAGFAVVLHALPLRVFYLYLALYMLTRIVVSVISRQPVWKQLLLIIPQQLAMGLFLYKAVVNTLLNQYTWKGRTLQP